MLTAIKNMFKRKKNAPPIRKTSDNTVRNIVIQEGLEEVFVVQFYTQNGKPIFKTRDPIHTYVNAVIEGSQGLEEIELAASFNIEKYYKRKGDK